MIKCVLWMPLKKSECLMPKNKNWNDEYED